MVIHIPYSWTPLEIKLCNFCLTDVDAKASIKQPVRMPSHPVRTSKRKPFPKPPPDSDADDAQLTRQYSIGCVCDNHNWFRTNLKSYENRKPPQYYSFKVQT